MTPPWQLHPAESNPLRDELNRELGIHPVIAGILQRRGVTTLEEARRFLQPRLEHLHDPFLLKGMEEAVALIVRTLASNGRIVISGDYDVDGVTASALLGQFLRDSGSENLDIFIPSRFDHGYGLTAAATEALLERNPDLVITVDNGITAVEEVALLHSAGVATIITDHHMPREAGIPPGIVINPLQPGCPYPFKAISGCGVAFKLVMALRKRLREAGWWNPQRPEPNIKNCLDLVAIGTIADVVPLLGENRVITHFGLEMLNRPDRRAGVEALLSFGRPEPVSAHTVAFRIGPRINAAGRMAEGSLAVDLLLAENGERAMALAQRLESENDKRRAKGAEMQREAEALVTGDGASPSAGIVVCSPSFHEGIIGITAARLVDKFHRPAVVMAENGDNLKGSARSLAGINVTKALESCADLLIAFGGHPGAAGCKLARENLPQFRERFAQACAEMTPNGEPPPTFLDGRLDPSTLSEAFVQQLAQLEPFGHQNEEPAFLVEQNELKTAPEMFGKGHAKWRLPGRAEMIAWRADESLRNPHPETTYRVRAEINRYRGSRNLQLIVEDFSHE